MNNCLDQLLKLCDSELEHHLLPPIFRKLGTADCKALYKLLKQCHCDSHIERILLCTLFEKLSPKFRGDLVVGHPISDVKTCIDFAFPEAKIAIYCDGFGPHTKHKPFTDDSNQCAFSRDRYQSRELQLQDWLVLRFSQRDIERYANRAVDTILRALNRSKANDTVLGKRDVDNAGKPILENLDQSNDPGPYYHHGGVDCAKGNYDHAIVNLTKAIELNPNFAEAYNNRGIAYRKEGDYDHAIDDYTKAIELKPDFAKAYNNRGNAYSDKGDYTRAIADYTKAIKLKPDFASAHNNRGTAYLKKGDYTRANADHTKTKHLKKAL